MLIEATMASMVGAGLEWTESDSIGAWNVLREAGRDVSKADGVFLGYCFTAFAKDFVSLDD